MSKNDLPRINAYRCKACGAFRITVDVDCGVTPFMLRCPDPKCKGFGESCFYRVPEHIRPQIYPTHEWYTPDEAEMKNLNKGTREHVDKGGLLIREITGRGHEAMRQYCESLGDGHPLSTIRAIRMKSRKST